MRLASFSVHVIDSINDWIGKFNGYLVLPFIFFLVYELVQRYVFKSPSIWIEEAVLLAFGVYLMLGGAYTLLHKMHVNVDILYRRWSPRTRAIVDLITSMIFFFFIGLMLWKGGEMAWTSIQNLEHSRSVWRPIIYPIKSMVPLAAFLVLLQGVAKFIRDLNLAITGRELL